MFNLLNETQSLGAEFENMAEEGATRDPIH